MARDSKDWLQIGQGKTYFHLVHRPLQCLIFLLPLLLFYQIASFVMPVHPWAGGRNLVAFQLMVEFFAFFGAFGNVLPLLAVVAILLFWHLARKDPWEFDPPLYGGMLAESILLGMPLVVLMAALHQHPGGAALGGAGVTGGIQAQPWQARLVLSAGAGIYEELLFRLMAINVLSMIFMDVLDVKPAVAVPLIVVISAVLFSLSHYLGEERFSMDTFGSRTIMGIYWAGVYMYRGFGVAVGAHTVYDVVVLVLLRP